MDDFLFETEIVFVEGFVADDIVQIAEDPDNGCMKLSFEEMDRLCQEWIQWRHNLTPGSGKCLMICAPGPIPRGKPRPFVDNYEVELDDE